MEKNAPLKGKRGKKMEWGKERIKESEVITHINNENNEKEESDEKEFREINGIKKT